jgi:polyhydroxybutyrate depolymerase
MPSCHQYQKLDRLHKRLVLRVFACPILAGVLFMGGFLAPDRGCTADVEQKIRIQGIERSYHVHSPNLRDQEAVPLVLMLHGGGGSGVLAATQTRFSDEADREGFIVAYPDGTDRYRPMRNLLGKAGFLTWNAGGCCGYAMSQSINDVGFLRAVIGEIERDYRIDPRRVYVAGISNGGMMAYRLACEASDIIAAVGVVSGVLVTQPCVPSVPVSVIDIHGTHDEYVPLNGGVGRKSLVDTPYPPIRDSISFWAGIDQCVKSQAHAKNGVLIRNYEQCRGDTAVTYIVIEGGGHAWPGGERMSPLLDAPSTAVTATAVVWQFFAAHAKQ